MSKPHPILPLSIMERIFSNWTSLKMLVEHGMGTSRQAHEFCVHIRDKLGDKELVELPDYIANELEQYMEEVFNTEIQEENGYCEYDSVAEDILRFYKIFLENDADKLESEMATLPNLQSWIIVNEAPRVTIRSEENETNSKNNSMEVDEDGFTMVSSKRKK